MWTTLSLLAVLSLAPGQAGGDLDLTNIRTTYGLLGPARAENKFVPGDTFMVAFDIDNIKVADNGDVLYTMAMEVIDNKTKKALFKQDPRDLKAVNSLGGKKVPAFANVDIGFDLPQGTYTLNLTVTDRATKKSKKLTREFEVLPLKFGLVRLQIYNDPNFQMVAPPVGVTGQTIWVNFIAVGFKRAGPKDAPNLNVELRVFDDKDQPTLAKYTPEVINELPKDIVHLPMQFRLDLNRPGKFTVKLKATDNNSKTTAEISFPLTVLESK